MPKITIHHSGKITTVETESAKSLLELLQSSNLELYAPCGGKGTCGKCLVRVKNEGHVVACTCYPDIDMEIYLPDTRESSILTAQYDHTVNVPFSPGSIVRKAAQPLGLAVDIGTTTLAIYLLNLSDGSILMSKGIINPQGKFGADVISRIQYCSKPGGLKMLQKVIIDVLNKEILHLAERAVIDHDRIVKVTVTGNTTMLHLLAGVDPTSIALAPFKPVFTDKKIIPAKELGLKIYGNVEVHLLPSVSGYVGADIVAGLASLDTKDSIRNYLFIDIGTNGEMALVYKDKIFCCATAAGPAFEGANISCGMGALRGAIASYEGPENYKTIGDALPVGICGSGLIDIVAYMVNNHIVDYEGLLEQPLNVTGNEGNAKQEIMITQQDIREVQLAKAAIRAGINILLSTAGIALNEVDAIFLAGGFGNHISVESAATIGLLPLELMKKTITVGNTSASGAILALKSELFDEHINRVLERTEYIELSTNEDFVMEYAMNMYF